MYTWKITEWTSELIISADIELTEHIKALILRKLTHIKNCYSKWGNGKDDLHDCLPKEYVEYGYEGDLTCMLKGLAIDYISKILKDIGSLSHIISFGGDIFAIDVPSSVSIDGTKFKIEINGTYSIFTSGNTNKRGNHIVGGEENYISTVVVKWNSLDTNNTLVDILATKLVSKEIESSNSIANQIDDFGDIHVFNFKDGKLINSVYGASPFFNPDQIAIRDKMVSELLEVFRPDLTESSLKYDGDHGDDSLVNSVVNDNLYGIDKSEYLVFPSRTTDLGTLFEVGVAIGKGKYIIRYDELNDTYIIVASKFNIPVMKKKILFDCSDKVNAVSLGYCSTIPWIDIYYELKGSPDNIMLSVNYKHIELINGRYERIERDKRARDK